MLKHVTSDLQSHRAMKNSCVLCLDSQIYVLLNLLFNTSCKCPNLLLYTAAVLAETHCKLTQIYKNAKLLQEECEIKETLPTPDASSTIGLISIMVASYFRKRLYNLIMFSAASSTRLGGNPIFWAS